MLSGRDSETDRIVGLDLGADDYLVKPFSPGELAARARSVLRRSAESTRQRPRTPFRPTGSGVEIDRESRNVWVDGAPVELAAKEFDLLAYLVDHPRRGLLAVGAARRRVVEPLRLAERSRPSPSTSTACA